MGQRREHLARDFNGYRDAEDLVLRVVFREIAHNVDGEEILARLDRTGDIAADLPEHTYVRADFDAIQPHICNLGYGLEVELEAPIGDGVREMEIVSVPSSLGCLPIEGISIEAVHLRFVEFVADPFRGGNALKFRETHLPV
jgi:hypothetical protein